MINKKAPAMGQSYTAPLYGGYGVGDLRLVTMQPLSQQKSQ